MATVQADGDNQDGAAMSKEIIVVDDAP
eukprot:SAG22_NODE_19448_length_275_cov_0.261364_1_plen_27_part_01